MSNDTGEKEADTPEVKAEETPPETDALKSQITELQTQLEDKDKAMKGHQRLSEERMTKLREAEASGARIGSVEKTQEVLLEMIGDLINRGESDDEPPRRKTAEDYLKKLKSEETTTTPQQLPPEAQEAVRISQLAGMDFNTSPELAEPYRLLSLGLYSEGLEATKRVVNEKTKTVEPKKELSDEDIKKILKGRPELRDELAREDFDKSGKNVSDVDLPAGGTSTRMEDFGKYARGEMTSEEAKKKGLF